MGNAKKKKTNHVFVHKKQNEFWSLPVVFESMLNLFLSVCPVDNFSSSKTAHIFPIITPLHPTDPFVHVCLLISLLSPDEVFLKKKKSEIEADPLSWFK